MKYKTYFADGYWKDNNEKFSDMCVATGEWDGVEDAEDEHIFFYLDGADPIGDHGDFVITDICEVQMITEKEVIETGYEVLPRGGWIYVDPEIMPRDWDDLAKSFGFDPDCRGVYLCVAGFKEVPLEENEDEHN